MTGHNQIWHHFFTKKYSSILMTSKIKCSQLYDQSEPIQWKFNNIRHFSMEHIQIWHLFLLKNIKVFQWLSNSKFLNFMTKVNPNYGNKTKSDISLRDIFKSDTISLQKWQQSSEIKSHGTCANLTALFFIYKVVHCLNDLWNLFLDKVYH